MPFPIEARFTGEGGWPAEAEKAARLLTIGEIYTLTGIQVGQSSSYLTLKGFPAELFNTVMFDAADSEEEDEPSMAERLGITEADLQESDRWHDSQPDGSHG